MSGGEYILGGGEWWWVYFGWCLVYFRVVVGLFWLVAVVVCLFWVVAGGGG